jgi:putative transposase
MTVKSITGREMWDQHESLLEQEFWNGGFWERSFSVGTTGEMSNQTVERYINSTEHV